MIEEHMHKGFKIVISEDDEPENPREWCNLGKMVCFHGRYRLGDLDHGLTIEAAQALEAKLTKAARAVILPLYLYDHGGLAMSHESFIGRAHHAEWDSGRVGFIYADEAAIRAEYGNAGKASLERAKSALIAEVKAYNQYLGGEVYEYDVKAKDGTHSLEFCGGFYDPADALRSAKDAVDILAA